MRILIQFCSGHDQPLIYPNYCYTISMYTIIIIFCLCFIIMYYIILFVGSEFEEDCTSEDSCPEISDSYIESLSMFI